MRPGLAISWAALLAALACVPGPGAFALDAVRGRVVDRDTGEPIRGAEVIEWYHGAGSMGGPQPVYHARWTRSDAEGRFALERAFATSPRMWLLETYGPSYSFFHPSYGLIRSGASPGPVQGELELGGSLRDSASRWLDLAPYCHGEPGDAGARHLREVACPLSELSPYGNGAPRVTGETDSRGRRTGTWTFHYEDGSVAARGSYVAGAPTGAWIFYGRDGRPAAPRGNTVP